MPTDLSEIKDIILIYHYLAIVLIAYNGLSVHCFMIMIVVYFIVGALPVFCNRGPVNSHINSNLGLSLQPSSLL